MSGPIDTGVALREILQAIAAELVDLAGQTYDDVADFSEAERLAWWERLDAIKADLVDVEPAAGHLIPWPVALAEREGRTS